MGVCNGVDIRIYGLKKRINTLREYRGNPVGGGRGSRCVQTYRAKDVWTFQFVGCGSRPPSSTKELELYCFLYEFVNMKEDKIKIELEVYDELIEVNVSKGEEMIYYDAAKFVTDRFEAYTRMYLGTKSQHTISLMTMLDIAVKLMPDNGVGQ